MNSLPLEPCFEISRLRLRQTLELRGIRCTAVLDAIQRTRRDLFVPEAYRDRAYEDDALPIGANQTISQPYIVALMTEALELTGDETVLEIGTGSGYQTAILAQLCRAVVTVERIAELSARARSVLALLELDNIDFHVGDGTLGWPDRAPYDGVIVTAAAPEVPAPLYNQLKLGGRLVVPVGDEAVQILELIRKTADGPKAQDLCGCRFVKLIGDAGWDERAPFS